MRRVVSYCKRHMAQEEHLKSEKSPEELEKTKSTRSLKNWVGPPLHLHVSSVIQYTRAGLPDQKLICKSGPRPAEDSPRQQQRPKAHIKGFREEARRRGRQGGGEERQAQLKSQASFQKGRQAGIQVGGETRLKARGQEGRRGG